MNGTNLVLNFPYFIGFMFPVNFLIQEICYLHADKLVCKIRIIHKIQNHYNLFTYNVINHSIYWSATSLFSLFTLPKQDVATLLDVSTILKLMGLTTWLAGVVLDGVGRNCDGGGKLESY